MATFLDRLKQTIGERGYEHGLRRSIQTILLYEAYRCIATRIVGMRPFQRKLAFFDQVTALVEATEFLPHQRAEIMWRTGTSKEAMNSDTAWKRMKLIEKELEKLCDKVKPLCVPGKEHDMVLDEYIQKQFEVVSGTKDRPCPPGWEHSHNNVIMTYRMYYDRDELDPTFPPAIPIKDVVVPAARPKPGEEPGYMVHIDPESNEDGIAVAHQGGLEGAKLQGVEIVPMPREPDEQRMAILKEVRTHLDLLNDFVGIIPLDLLNKRKRQLFQALPAPPPSAVLRSTAAKRAKPSSDSSDGEGAAESNEYTM